MLYDFYNQVGVHPHVFAKMASFVEGDLALLIKNQVASPNNVLSAYWPEKPYPPSKKIYVVSDSTLNLGTKTLKGNYGFEH